MKTLKEQEKVLGIYLKKFPETPTLTLAKLAYKEHPQLFLSVEGARSMIRYRRGNRGKAARQCAKKKHKYTFRENGKAGYNMELPKSIAKPLRNINLPNGKYLIMSDVHVPYHDLQAVEACLDYSDKQNIDHIVLNGDICDFFAVSRWQKNPEERNLSQELMLTRQFLQHLRERYPQARIFYKIGNHEERWEAYMFTKSPELLGVDQFEIRNLLNFSKYGIEEVAGRQKIKAGKHLTIIHGHELFGGSAPVNFARTLLNNLGVCAIAGHRHRTSEHAEKDADGRHTMAWSLGCLCDMQPEYATINKWNHGFAIMDLQGSHFEVDNKRIIKGKIV